MKVTVRKFDAGIFASVKELTKSQVLVGVPDANAPRNADEEEAKKGEPINNATIGYIMEFGAPNANIPARPHLMPGISDAKDSIADQLKKGAQQALAGKAGAADIALNKVGLIASSAVKARITEGPFTPLAETTLRARRARGRTGEKPLLDTGQYRNSQTYVIRPKGK
ncbi:MAG: hypothetical protein B7Z41_00800 [Rhizobiales bacterium 12-66-7]|nr:MAG: hypothetical protein B7Z41_00800 [Rhizobiales bacterium 12-66-7]